MTLTKEQVKQIWDEIPFIDCKGYCWDTCGVVACSESEEKMIQEFCEKNNIPFEPFKKAVSEEVVNSVSNSVLGREQICPYLKDKRCSIHSVRPAICRLWGVVQDMTCPFGCVKKKVLPKKKGHDIIERLDENSQFC